MPRIEVAAEHDDLTARIGPGNLRDRVVRGLPFRIPLVDDVDLELHREPVGEQTRDAAEVLVAQDHRRRRLRPVVGGVAEGADLAVIAPRIVDADLRAAGDEEGVDLLGDPARREPRRIAGLRTAGIGAAELRRPRIDRVELRREIVGVAAKRRLREGDRHRDAAPTSTILPATCAFIVSRYVASSGAVGRCGRDQVHGAGAHRPVGPVGPRQHFTDERVLHRRDEVRGETLVEPARMPEVPRLEMTVREAPLAPSA